MSASVVLQWRSSMVITFLLIVHGGLILLLALLPASVQAQNVSSIDPAEAAAFNAIFTKWGIISEIKWNSTEDPCSGKAINDAISIDDDTNNPFIKCDCSINSGTTCHITKLKVKAMDVTGEIPDELWTLTHLTNLNLAENYLTGSLSPSIRNLTKMIWLTFGSNMLSGSVPKELGQLSRLKSLSFNTNNFSGPLPSEIGNIVSLEQLYMDSSGVSGEIPSNFANLVNMQTMWASDNELNGSIPEFIGTWTQLTDLRLEGNSFIGSIPSSAFSNLTFLQTLRIGDLSNGSSSMEFIPKLVKLTTLVLRNVNFSDSIPTDLGGLTLLTYLDLSSNNIIGTIPDSLFTLASLIFLFLGNNKLIGSLPSQKGPSLANIDVSYNQLSGNIPSWISSKLQINLVANNFTGISNSALPFGLNCLQNDFPCFRDSPRYYSFAVKCGGPEIKSFDGTVFEKENEALGPATYYVPDTKRWAVSNAGYFLFSGNASYVASLTRQFNTLDSEIYQTARLSGGSLRYYGLGLENGNYTVTLQFTELIIQNGKTWESLGRRVFDIYIQGNLALKNFDIRKAAGGQSFKDLKKNFTALVTTNHIEIHLLWVGKGTCCIPARGIYGPSISAVSVTPNFVPTVSNKPPSNKNKTGLILAIVLPLGCICLLILPTCYVVLKRRKLREARDKELMGVEAKPYLFSYSELKSSTEDFNASHKLGEGGFGPVFKGTLSDGRDVAVKQLSFKSHQGKSQFVAEIATISTVRHRNLVRLYGCCLEGEKRLLVYEYLENGSLDQALFGKGPMLSWAKRFEICKGVAKGLAYLHQESRLRIIHRDVKASNILLDSNLIPMISDFGLAKLYNEKDTHVSTGVAGTVGYLAPEYAMRGHLSEKVDVFSFGVLALEIVSGRTNSDTSLSKEKMYLIEWTWQLYEANREVELIDDKLMDDYEEEEVKRVIRVGLLCTQTSPGQRPSMSRAVAMLSGDVEVGVVPAKPGYLTDWVHENATFQTSTISSYEGAFMATMSTSTTITSEEQVSPLFSTIDKVTTNVRG